MAESPGDSPQLEPDEQIFQPKEDLVTMLTAMGVSRNAAVRALYHTGNNNADLAAAWIFEYQDEDLDAPFEIEGSSDEEGAGFYEGGAMHKMVFVVNTQLAMGVGKIAAQVGHAALGVYKILLAEQSKYGEALLQWEHMGETKIVLKGNSTKQLIELSVKATALELPNYLVKDAGKTQVEAGSVTVLGIMGKNDIVDQVTGSLALL